MLIDDMIAELQAALLPAEAQLEGFRDYQKMLDKSEEQPTRAEVGAAIKLYDQRVTAIENAIAALEALQTAAYPEPVEPVFTPDAVARLKENRDSVDTAFDQVEPLGEATTATVAVGAAVPRF